jgi:hypothetical protein
MLEATLDKIAEKIIGLDEASLTGLWEKYKRKMEDFEVSREWEKSVIIFFIINSVRVKNHIFNEQILRQQNKKEPVIKVPPGKPDLKRIK